MKTEDVLSDIAARMPDQKEVGLLVGRLDTANTYLRHCYQLLFVIAVIQVVFIWRLF
ncbi:MAG: hypothetical protein HYX46_02850 [Betaproteobacteria bacterium]|nr:hypothetical protein [Betaproteobacteria bacterium]